MKRLWTSFQILFGIPRLRIQLTIKRSPEPQEICVSVWNSRKVEMSYGPGITYTLFISGSFWTKLTTEKEEVESSLVSLTFNNDGRGYHKIMTPKLYKLQRITLPRNRSTYYKREEERRSKELFVSVNKRYTSCLNLIFNKGEWVWFYIYWLYFRIGLLFSFILSPSSVPLYRSVHIKLLSVCFSLSTPGVPVCI